MLHSVQYGRPVGMRDSTVCSFQSEESGIIQKFSLCKCLPVNVLFVKLLTNQSILRASGNPGRDVHSQYADIDISSLITLVS